jgi:hypothetical protein
MNPVAPVYQDKRVLPDDVSEIIIAKDQPEYKPLPAVVLPQGEVITRWKLSEKELRQVTETGSIHLTVLTFGRPLQPVILSVEPPELGQGETSIPLNVEDVACAKACK